MDQAPEQHPPSPPENSSPERASPPRPSSDSTGTDDSTDTIGYILCVICLNYFPDVTQICPYCNADSTDQAFGYFSPAQSITNCLNCGYTRNNIECLGCDWRAHPLDAPDGPPVPPPGTDHFEGPDEWSSDGRCTCGAPFFPRGNFCLNDTCPRFVGNRFRQ